MGDGFGKKKRPMLPWGVFYISLGKLDDSDIYGSRALLPLLNIESYAFTFIEASKSGRIDS